MIKKYINFSNFPIIITVIYLLFTLFLYEFGPINWETSTPLIFWSLQTLYIVALISGWVISKKYNFKTSNNKCLWNTNLEDMLLKHATLPLSINLIIEIINLFRRFYMQSFDFIELFNHILQGITNMGAGYAQFQINTQISGSEVVGGVFITLVN